MADNKNRQDMSRTDAGNAPEKKPGLLRRIFTRRGGTTTTSVFLRTVLVMSVLGFAAFAVLIAQLFKVQLVDYEEYQRKAVSQQTRNDIITPSRGTIYDCNGKQLAVSASVETVILNPKNIKDAAQSAIICDGLSSILDIDYDTLAAKASKKTSQYEYVAKKIERKAADKVRAFIEENKLSGIVYLIDDTKRYYPYGNFLSHVLGFCGADNNGLYGIELYYDDELTGEPGRIISAKNGRGVDMMTDFEHQSRRTG